jgi:hypothetical protein
MRRQPWIRHLWQHGLPAAHRLHPPAAQCRGCLHFPAAAFSSQAQTLRPSLSAAAAPVDPLRSPAVNGKAEYHVLGVETTCDDTALAILNNKGYAHP